jgi:hypothetical protein
MNFRPEKVFLGKNPDGSKLRIEEWDYDTRATLELPGNFMYLFTCILFVQIISPLLLIACIKNFNGRGNFLNFIGILLGGYFLYDASHGWLVTNFLHILLSEKIINILVYLNAVAVALHILLLLFSGLIYTIINKLYDTEDKCEFAFLLFLLIIGVFVYACTDSIIRSHPGWVNNNIQECLKRNEEPEPVQVEEVKPVYDDGFFHHDPNWDPMK